MGFVVGLLYPPPHSRHGPAVSNDRVGSITAHRSASHCICIACEDTQDLTIFVFLYELKMNCFFYFYISKTIRPECCYKCFWLLVWYLCFQRKKERKKSKPKLPSIVKSKPFPVYCGGGIR